jgi:hypothetical protein
MTSFIDGYVSHFKNELYKNASWIKLTTIWLGIILIPWFMPLPYINAGWELKWQDLKAVKWEEVKSEWFIDISKIWWRSSREYKWLNLLSFPEGEIHMISSDIPNVQIEKANWRIYFSWVNPDQINIKQINTNDTYQNIVIIWNWRLDKDKNYIDTWIWNNPVTQEIQPEKTSWLSKGLEINIDKEVGNTQNLRNILNQVISYDALANSKWLYKLQKMIFENRNYSKPTTDDVWNQYLEVLKDKWFKKYVNKKWSYDNLLGLSNRNYTTNEEILILQTISSNLMEKWWLQAKWEDYLVKWW